MIDLHSPCIEQLASHIFKVEYHSQHGHILPRSQAIVTAPEFSTADIQPSLQLQRHSEFELSFICEQQRVLKQHLVEAQLEPNSGDLSVRCVFLVDQDEAFYGLGQFQHGKLNLRGSQLRLAQSNLTIAAPVLISSKGYAIIWDSLAVTDFHSNGDSISFDSTHANGIRYYLIYGPQLNQLQTSIRQLTGQAAMLPRWAYGYWQCKERYVDQQELLDTAAKFRELEFPIDCIIQDWKYWGDLPWSSMQWDSQVFPEPQAMLEQLHQQHFQVMISIWPVVGEGSPIYQDLAEKQLLFTNQQHWAKGHIYDAFDPMAQQIYWQHLDKGIMQLGMDALWMDGTEPEFIGGHQAEANLSTSYQQGQTAAGHWRQVANGYSYATTQGVYQQWRRDYPDKRPVILSRSGGTGQQQFAAASWSGDIAARWEVLAAQIPAGLNYCATGNPYWTTDIGGFFTTGFGANFPEGCEDEAYRELYVRWFQFGAFCPLFRSHGANTPREPWQFGGTEGWAYPILRQYTELRYRLLPYIYSQAYQVHANHQNLMQSLPERFRDNAAVLDITDQYLFGPSIMVSPVLEPMFHQAKQDAQLIGPPYLSCADGKPGAQMYLYKDAELSQQVGEEHCEQIDGNWAGGPPAGLPNQGFSIAWQAQLSSDQDGEHQLMVFGNDGKRVYLDEQLVLDSWQTQAQSIHRISVQLKAEQRYQLRVEYQHLSGSAKLGLWWRKPNQAKPAPLAAAKRSVYLPANSDWWCYWSEQQFSGGQSLSVDTPLAHLPLHVAAGSIIPHGPVQQYHNQIDMPELELRIYPGADAEFALYDDSGNGYAFEQGKFSLIRLSWNDAQNTLNVAEQQGSYNKGKARRFRVKLVGAEQVKSLEYHGQAISIGFE